MTQIQIIGLAIVVLSVFVYFVYADKIQKFINLKQQKLERNKKKKQAHQVIDSISIMLGQIDILEKIKAGIADDIFSSISQTGLNEISTKVENLRSTSSSYDDDEIRETYPTPVIHAGQESTPSWVNKYKL